MMLIRSLKMPMLRQIKLSDARMKRYYILSPKKPEPKMAEKYQDRTKYDFLEVKRGNNKVHLLCDLKTNEWVIANPKSFGTPKYIKINFQNLWNSNVSEHTRNQIALEMKESYQEALSKVVPITEGFPLKTNFTMHTVKQKTEEQDVDNLTILYVKTFHDALVQSGIIPDDKLKYLKRYEAGHEYADEDYITVDIYSLAKPTRMTRRMLMMAS